MSDLPEYFIIANKIVERAERGLPQDRWMRGDKEQEALVRLHCVIEHLFKYACRHDPARI